MTSSSHKPSLYALRAFESAARLRSMSAAAQELFVRHGAISRHIRALEDTLGVTLSRLPFFFAQRVRRM